MKVTSSQYNQCLAADDNEIATICCEIRGRDIEAMDFWLNESPMADPPSQNAISLALKRLLLPGISVRIHPRKDGSIVGMVDGQPEIEFSKTLCDWYAKAMRGYPVNPVTGEIRVAKRLLSRIALADQRRETWTRRMKGASPSRRTEVDWLKKAS